MHSAAYHSLACCLYHNTYDPDILPGSANQCILGDMYLRSNLPRKQYCDHNVGSTVSIILLETQQAQSKDGGTTLLPALTAFAVVHVLTSK